jgi:AcrR family transcriptional regulator
MNFSASASTPSTENDGLRERILRASITLIEQEGLAALSLREVARRAGVSHQAPYHYFADREAILATLAEHGFAMLRAAVEEACRPGVAPTEALELAGIAYVQFACDHPAHFRIMFRPELVSLKNRDNANVSPQGGFDRIRDLSAQFLKAGFPESVGVDVLSTLFWSISHGLSCLLLDGPLVMRTPEFMKDQKRTIAQVVRAGRLMVEATIAQERAARAKRVSRKNTRNARPYSRKRIKSHAREA